MLQTPSYPNLFRRYKTEMEALGFTHWAEGSTVGGIGRVLAAYAAEAWTQLAYMEEQGNLSTARGSQLDRIGEGVGVFRLPAQTASTVGRGPALRFTNNGSSTVVIPAGTRVWSPEDPSVAFFTTQALSLNAGAQGYVDIQGSLAGEAYNVGAGVLTNHNAGMSQVSSTNIRPIGGGTFSESDASYRYRITQANQAQHGANAIAIEQSLLALPGIREVVIRSGMRGPGTLDITIVPVDRYVSVALLETAREAVDRVVVAGVSWEVLSPVTRRVDVRIQLRLRAGSQISEVRPSVDAAVRSYLDNLRMNDGRGDSDVIYNELLARVQESSPQILDSSVQLTVDGIPSLQTNISPGPGERFVSGSVSVS